MLSEGGISRGLKIIPDGIRRLLVIKAKKELENDTVGIVQLL